MNIDEVELSKEFLAKIDTSLVKEFITMDAPVKDHNGIKLEAKTRSFSTEVTFDKPEDKEFLLNECIKEVHEEMKRITQNGSTLFAFYTLNVLKTAKITNDSNDPLIKVCNPMTFESMEAHGKYIFGLKIRYAVV